jgi:hypothetical protein
MKSKITPPENIEYRNGIPIAQAVLVSPSSKSDPVYSWVVPVCPLCGHKHSHGAGTEPHKVDELLGHRVAHCPKGHNHIQGYILVKAANDGQKG